MESETMSKNASREWQEEHDLDTPSLDVGGNVHGVAGCS
jgi:hypothetical protein